MCDCDDARFHSVQQPLLFSLAICVVLAGIAYSNAWGQEAAAPKWSRAIERILNFEEEEQRLLNSLQAKEDPAKQSSLHDELGILYADFDQYAKAVQQFRHALNGDSGHDLEDTQRLDIANHLAQAYLALGQFANAKSLLTENIETLESATTDPDDTPALATGDPDKQISPDGSQDRLGDTLALLAEYHRETGDFDKAAELHQQVLDRRRQVYGAISREYSVALHNLGIFEWRRGHYQSAEDRLREDLRVTTELSGKPTDTAHSHESLALLLTHTGEFAESEVHYRKALEIYDNGNAAGRELYRTKNNLGYLHIFTGQHDSATALLTEAAEGRKQLLGDSHPDYADSLNDLARLEYVQGHFSEAIGWARESLDITRRSVTDTAAVQSERQQLSMQALFRDRLDVLLSAAAHVPESAADVFAEIFAWKGAVLVRQRTMRRLAQDAEVASRFRELQTLTLKIASLSRSLPADPFSQYRWRGTLQQMKNEQAAMEAEISQLSSDYQAALTRVSVASLVKLLPENGAFVDFYEYGNIQAANDTGRFESTPSFMASVLTKDGSVDVVQFGPSVPIISDINTWRAAFGNSAEATAAGRRLRDRLWSPLAPFIENADTLIVSPDGILGTLPFGALPGREADTYLIEDHRLVLVAAPQLLPAMFRDDRNNEFTHDLLLMGDVDYDAGDSEPAKQRRRRRPSDRRSGDTGLLRSGGEQFQQLTGASGEIAFIQKLYTDLYGEDDVSIALLEKQRATELRFRELAPNCFQLHLATHGFFASPDKQSALKTTGRESDGLFSGQEHIIRGFSPGMLSGLAFSGANQPPQPDKDDGILTADEIAFLPLHGVDLAVLSACETGLGEVAGGEGLLGIQRSFQVAGVRSTIASLWKVPDTATRVLMERFYENYLDKEMSRLDSLRDAQLWVLNNPDSVRGDKRLGPATNQQPTRTPPHFWAAFVLSGDWR